MTGKSKKHEKGRKFTESTSTEGAQAGSLDISIHDDLNNSTPEDTDPIVWSLLQRISAHMAASDEKITALETKWGSSLLHEAVSEAKLEMVETLLKGNCDVNITDQVGQTPLHLACRRGNLDIVKSLLDHGADSNSRTKSRRAPLHIAVWRRHLDTAYHLMESGADVNQQDEDGWSSLHWASKDGHTQLVQDMIEKGARLDLSDRRGQTPLHLCLQSKNMDLEMMKLLLSNGADPNQPTKTSSCLDLLLENPSASPLAVSILYQGGYLPCVDSRSRLPKSTDNQVAKHKVVLANQGIASLFKLCRYTIRKRLNSVHQGRAVGQYVNTLPIPELLKDYLMFKEEMTT